jgi:hypothetical protein
VVLIANKVLFGRAVYTKELNKNWNFEEVMVALTGWGNNDFKCIPSLIIS